MSNAAWELVELPASWFPPDASHFFGHRWCLLPKGSDGKP